MVLTTGAQRNVYLQLNINEIKDVDHIYNTKTNEVQSDVLSLYYYIYDENHTPYDAPKVDSVDDYMLVLKDGRELPLSQYLEHCGYYSMYYAVISNHNKITSVEHFKVNNHDNFYSIQINKDVATFLEVVGLDNVTVVDDGDYYLPTLAIRSGYELLFFLDAHSNDNIYTELNQLKYEIVSNNLKQIIRNKIIQGLPFVLESGTLVHLTYTLKDKLELDKSIKLKLNTLVNNGKAYIVTKKDLEVISTKLSTNEINYKNYLKEALNEPLEFWSDWRRWEDLV